MPAPDYKAPTPTTTPQGTNDNALRKSEGKPAPVVDKTVQPIVAINADKETATNDEDLGTGLLLGTMLVGGGAWLYRRYGAK
jgi:hypothetical protein